MVDRAEPVLITHAQAAEILGVSRYTVAYYTTAGLLDSPGQSGPGVPTLKLEQVQALADKRVQARQNRRPPPQQRRAQPPDDGRDWLSLGQTAQKLGVTRSAISQRCRRGTIPFVEHEGQRWFRRDLIETWSHARTAQQSRQP